MKNITEPALVAISFVIFLFFVILLGFSMDAYGKYLDTYNTQKDREMFLKSYEIVIECRKSYGVNDSVITKICGNVPSFSDKVN
jgi:hypothetical protein